MDLLGLAAPLVALNRGVLDILGGGPRTTPAAYRLARELGMVTAEAARARIEGKLRAARAPTQARPAWELVRAAAWTGTAYRAHLVDAATAARLLRRAATIARARYEGWEAYGADFVAGRRAFLGRPGEGVDDEAAAVARLLHDPASPWGRRPWRAAAPSALRVHAARVIRVGPRGDAPTIRRALALAAAGDVIEIAAGTYREALRPTADVELVARGRVTITHATSHVLLVDGIGVRTTGIAWVGTHARRGGIVVTNGGVLHLSGGSVRSGADGIDLHHEGTLALLETPRIHACGGFGIAVVDHAWLHASGGTVARTARSAISVERGATATLVDMAIDRAGEVGLLVVEDGAAALRGGSIARSAWANAQLSAGTLELDACALAGGQSGVLVRGGRAALRDVAIDAPSKNGLELGGATARVDARDLTVTGAGSSAVLVAAGKLDLHAARIRAPRFDGVTTLGGEASVAALRVTAPGRAALWIEPGGAVALSSSAIRASAITAQPGARLSVVDAAAERAVAPFTLVAHPRGFSLIAGPAIVARLAPPGVASGHDFAAWARRQLASDRALLAKLAFDPESSMFAVAAAERDVLVEVARRLARAA